MSTLLPIKRNFGFMTPSRDTFLDPFEQVVDNFFDSFFTNGSLDKLKSVGGFPRLDVVVDDGCWIVEVSAPGHRAEDVKVEIVPDKNENILRLSGRMSEDNRYDNGATFYKREIKRSSWERLLVLPDYIKSDPDEAVMKNGILRLTWKVKELEKPKPKTIVIKEEN